MGIDIMLLGENLPGRLFPARTLCEYLPSHLDPIGRFRWHYYDEGHADLVKYVEDLKVWLANYDSKYETHKDLGYTVAQFIKEATKYIADDGFAYIDL